MLYEIKAFLGCFLIFKQSADHVSSCYCPEKSAPFKQCYLLHTALENHKQGNSNFSFTTFLLLFHSSWRTVPGTKVPTSVEHPPCVPNAPQGREHNFASWDQQDETWVTKFLNFGRIQCHKDLNNTMASQNWPFPLIKKPWENLQLAKILKTTTEIAGNNYSPDK